MPIRDERLCRRTKRILTRKPKRFNFTFDETTGALALADLAEVPLFTRRDVTVEQLTTALSADATFTVVDGNVQLTTPPAE